MLVAGLWCAWACGPQTPSPTGSAADSELRADLEAAQARVVELERQLREALAAPRPVAGADCERHAREVAEMREQLAREQEKRLAREREWLAFTTSLGSLELPLEGAPTFVAEVPDAAGTEEPATEQRDPELVAREKDIARSLRTLLNIEGVRGVDLLEAGQLGDGWIGPVLFRLLDDRGRLAGSVSAQRLRLEGSRTARTLTIVLEDGFETRGGERIAFRVEARLDQPVIAGGVRRMVLDDTDPMPWVAALGELFGDATFEAPKDDGRWNLSYVRAALNRLLRADAANGYWRVKSLGGVTGEEMREVHLEYFDSAGKLERRAFADVLAIVEQDKGYMLRLQDGAQVRGEEKLPFLDGRFRIYLPRAQHAEWRAARLPGLTTPEGESARSD